MKIDESKNRRIVCFHCFHIFISSISEIPHAMAAVKFLLAGLLCLALCGAVCGGAETERGQRGPWIREARSRSGIDGAANSLVALRLVLRGGAGEGDAGGEKGGEEAAAAAPDAINDEGDEDAAEGREEEDDEGSEDGQEMTKSPNIELLRHLGSKADPRNRRAQTEDMVRQTTHKKHNFLSTFHVPHAHVRGNAMMW